MNDDRILVRAILSITNCELAVSPFIGTGIDTCIHRFIIEL